MSGDDGKTDDRLLNEGSQEQNGLPLVKGGLGILPHSLTAEARFRDRRKPQINWLLIVLPRVVQ